MVSVVIPAFNEERTIAEAVRGVIGHPDILEVIVVDDGSTDETGVRARGAGASVITLPKNRGKAGAMNEGVARARGDVILFLDGDCFGFTHETISAILRPVLEGRHVMYVGINTRKSFWLNRLLHFFPILSGSRALRRELWEAVPACYKERFQIEIALNYFSRGFAPGSGFELIRGVSHVIKEEKHGFVQGSLRRLGMIRDIVSISLRLYVIRETRLFFAKAGLSLLGE